MRQFFRTLLYYLIVAVPMVLFNAYAYHLTTVYGFTEWTFVSYLKAFWLVSILFVVANAIGLVLYGHPDNANERTLRQYRKEGWDKSKKLIVSYVSYGKNAEALNLSLMETKALLDEYEVNYELEVVTDLDIEVQVSDVYWYKVPEEYETRWSTKFKARALHWALKCRILSGRNVRNAWVLHLDEESRLTASCIAGIHKATKREGPFIGQGEIKYNSVGYFSRPFIAIVDSIRTGDDLGRFRFQYKALKVPLFGLHGSFVLVPHELEEALGFDVGSKGSLTEDTCFAFKAADCGVPFVWVDGYIREQSPFTLLDLLKQRRRWFTGLGLLIRDPTISLWRRAFLALVVFSWSASWTSVFVTLATLILDTAILPLSMHYAASSIAGLFISLYGLGAFRNVVDLDMHPLRKAAIVVGTMIMVPIASVTESIAVLYALLNPLSTEFEVVKK